MWFITQAESLTEENTISETGIRSHFAPLFPDVAGQQTLSCGDPGLFATPGK